MQDESTPTTDSGMSAPTVETPAPKPPIHKRAQLILLILFLVAGAAGAGAYFAFSNADVSVRPIPPATATTSTSKTSVAAHTAESNIDAVIYNVSSSESKINMLYRQPIGGTAQQVQLPAGSMTSGNGYRAASYGQKVAVSSDNGVYISTNSGVDYHKVASLLPNSADQLDGETVTSLQFSADGNEVVYATVEPKLQGNSVRSVNIDGTKSETLFNSDKAGVFIVHYDSRKHTIIYNTGCYFCDGAPGGPQIMDLATKTNKVLTLATNAKEQLGSWDVNRAGTKLVYALGMDDNTYEGGLGAPFAPPYSIKEYDLATDQATLLYTIQPTHEKSTDQPNYYKTYTINVGYLADADTPYFRGTDGLYSVKGAATTKFLDLTDRDSESNVSSKQVLLTRYAANENKSSYSIYNIATKQTTAVAAGGSSLLAVTRR
jgi:hypothetical protein